MLKIVVVIAVLAIALPSGAQEFPPEELTRAAQMMEEQALQQREELLNAEARAEFPIWVLNDDGTFGVADGTQLIGNAATLIELAASSGIDQTLGPDAPGWMRTAAEAFAAGTISDANAAVRRAYRDSSDLVRAQAMAEIDRRLAAARALFDEASLPGHQRRHPAIYRIFTSSYGEIHWNEGYYGVPNKTLAITQIREDGEREVWIVAGRWGRLDNPERVGGFELWFSSACQFAGWWWYNEDRPASIDSASPPSTSWTGECL